MTETLFNPVRYDIPGKLILNPYFTDKKYFSHLKENAVKNFSLFHSTVLIYESYSVITDFIGYTQLLTILEFINNIRDKEIYFLGTAGSLNPRFNLPEAFNVIEINPSAVFDDFCNKRPFQLISTGKENFKSVKGVSVDIVQRETPEWLKEQKSKKFDIVEMEIYPLRNYLKKDFSAFVVITDLITEKGIIIFKDKKRINSELIRAFEFIMELIDEK